MTVERASGDSNAVESNPPLLPGVEWPTELKTTSNQSVPDSPLVIRTVRWGVTVNTGNYSSVRLDAEANVPTDGTAESTLLELIKWVREQSPLSDDEIVRDEKWRRAWREEQAELNNQIAEVRRQWQRCIAFCDAVGLEIPGRLTEDLPF
jgi:hypothetical protein